MKSTGSLEASILITNYNTAALLERCLSAVLREPLAGAEVVVFDNGSTDGSADLVRQHFPTVRLIVSFPNFGYVRAVNRLLEAGEGRVLVLLDSDAEPEPGALSHLIGALQEEPRLGAIGPRLVGSQGKLQRWTAGRLPSFTSVAAFYLGLDRLLARAGRDVGMFLSRDLTGPAEVAWLCSCCLAMRREALLAAGPMDDRYLSYMGDLDLCRRIGRAGWQLRYDPSVTVHHLQGRNTVREPGHAAPAALLGLDHYLGAQCGSLTRRALVPLEVAGYAGRALVYSVAGLLGGGGAARRAARMHRSWLRLRCGVASSATRQT